MKKVKNLLFRLYDLYHKPIIFTYRDRDTNHEIHRFEFFPIDIIKWGLNVVMWALAFKIIKFIITGIWH